VAWLLTYNGVDCALWRYVYSKCMESELCRRLIDLLPSVGYNLVMHKCYADVVEVDQAKQSNNSTTTTQHKTSTPNINTKNHAKLKNKVSQKQCRLDAYAPLLKTPSSHSPLLYPPPPNPLDSRGSGAEPSPVHGGPRCPAPMGRQVLQGTGSSGDADPPGPMGGRVLQGLGEPAGGGAGGWVLRRTRGNTQPHQAP